MKHLRDLNAINLLAENVRKFRLEKNLSMEELANLAGVEYSQISRIERSKINTSISLIFALSRALEIPASKLIEK